jgi:hypothetical protein
VYVVSTAEMDSVQEEWNKCNFVTASHEDVSTIYSETSYVLYVPAVFGIVQEYEDKIVIATSRLKTRVVPTPETSFISVIP